MDPQSGIPPAQAQYRRKGFEVMKTDEKWNLSMLCDFYELTMANGYLESGQADRITYFDAFFRSVPDKGGFAIAAGLEQLIDYIENLRFTEDDIAYLRNRGLFSERFLDYLRNFHFTGDIWAIPEGTPVFPREPLVTVRARAIEAQLIETFTLLTLNHQSLIATKANRIVRAANGRAVMEFGSRRAQGSAAAIDGARRLYRRLRRHCMHPLRSALWNPGARHNGARVGSDV